MAVRVRVDPIEKNLLLTLAPELSPSGRSATLAAFAGEALVEAEQQNAAVLGRVPDHETFVDGRVGARLESVRPDGVIVFEFDLLEELFVWVAEQLVRHSPFRS